MRVITDAEVRRYVTIEPIIAAVEEAFRNLDRGTSEIFPVVRATGSDSHHFFGIKSGRDGSTALLGAKLGSYIPSNHARGLPTHTSTTVLIDDATGALLAVVEADYLNGMRTAAANAAAARLLSRPHSRVLGIIGQGSQSVFEVEAIASIRPIERVLAATRSAASDGDFARRVKEKTGLEVISLPVEQVVRQADIVVTVTPSRRPVLEDAWVQPGTHIAAMGADNVGKMELPLDLIERSVLIVDHPAQAALMGEAQHIIAAGRMPREALEHRSLGALLNGAPGRTDPAQITIFDSSGTAIQDIAAAHAALHIVRRADAGASKRRRTT